VEAVAVERQAADAAKADRGGESARHSRVGHRVGVEGNEGENGAEVVLVVEHDVGRAAAMNGEAALYVRQILVDGRDIDGVAPAARIKGHRSAEDRALDAINVGALVAFEGQEAEASTLIVDCGGQAALLELRAGG